MLVACAGVAVSGARAEESAVLSAGRLRLEASAQRLSVSMQDQLLFSFTARVAVDLEGQPDRDLFEPAFRTEPGRCVWTVRSSNWEKKQYALSIDGDAAVLRVTVQGEGKLGKLRFFLQEAAQSGWRPVRALATSTTSAASLSLSERGFLRRTSPASAWTPTTRTPRHMRRPWTTFAAPPRWACPTSTRCTARSQTRTFASLHGPGTRTASNWEDKRYCLGNGQIMPVLTFT